MKKKLPLIINIFKSIKKKNNLLIINAFCLTKVLGVEKQEISKIKLKINNNEYKIHFSLKNGIPFIKKYKINFYRIEIPLDEILVMDIQNKIVLEYENIDNGRIIYSAFDLLKGKNRNSRIITYNNKSVFLRQTKKNTMYITVRESNIYDQLLYKFYIFFGFVLSKFMIKKDLILLYEKECQRYEESASVVYEKLIDQGYKNVYYILNKDNIKLDTIDYKYKNNIIYKDSFKHIIFFFKCKKFIATESLAHALQLRIANKLVVDKIQRRDIMYVFLQHGVMYMVSLSSDLRTDFRKHDIKLHKIVTSSKLEASHFTELGGFSLDDLYICGLPKFDTAIRYDTADKIVIMPTWRRWEANEASVNYENTKYYKMIKRIFDSIPKKLQDKVIILPHPLMLKEIKSNKKYKEYVPEGEFTYDGILKECKLLITDYSSIAYDAFYRGSNVIFYWEEKDECMEMYGTNAKLMLNEKNAFGDICYNKKDLGDIIEKNYNDNQTEKNKKNFKKIVEFSDNKNTERLIEMLKIDKMI